MRRKLFAAAVSMMSGMLVIRQEPLAAVPCAVLLIAFCGEFFLYHKRKGALLLLALFLAGAALMGARTYEIGRMSEDIPEATGHFSGKVLAAENKDEGKTAVVLRLIPATDRGNNNIKIMLTIYKDVAEPENLIGSVITFDARIEPPRPSSNPHCFDYRMYLYSRGIHHIASTSSFAVDEDSPGLWDRIRRRVLRIRERFLDGLICDADTRAMIRGILFGDTTALSDELYQDFRANGTAHVLAVSGLHIGVLFALYRRITRKRGGWIGASVLALLLLFYGTMALWSASVTRAVLLVLLMLGGDLLRRRYDLLTALAAAAILLMVREPYILYSTGFQMSFLAVLSLAFLCPVLELVLPQGIAASVAVQIGMVPYVAYTFNYIPVAAIVVNVPILWLLSVLVPSGLAAMLWFLLAGTGGLPGVLLCGMTQILALTNQTLSLDGQLAMDVVSWHPAVLLLFYLLLFLLTSEYGRMLLHRKDRKRLGRCLGAVLLCVLLTAAVTPDPFRHAVFTMVDVGQGDCLHVHLPRHTDLLLDGGGSEEYNIGEKVLKPYLLKNGCRDINLALATHLHTDHYQGLTELADCYPVREILTRGKAGDVIRIGGQSTIEILWPLEQDPDTDDENKNSLIFRVSAEDLSILVTGDIGADGELAMVEYYRGTDRLRCDILKVCHHGSRYSSSDAFLDAVSPSAAVIGVGKNHYGHPADETLARFKRRGIPVYRTDQDGAVGFWKEGGEIRVCTAIRKEQGFSLGMIAKRAAEQ